jgi:hypothetical protein
VGFISMYHVLPEKLNVLAASCNDHEFNLVLATSKLLACMDNNCFDDTCTWKEYTISGKNISNNNEPTYK